MLELFHYDFMLRALVVGVVVAITAAIVGNFLVAARQSVMSDMLAHTSLAGVGLGMFLHVVPSFLAAVVAVGASVVLWFLTKRSNRAPDAVAMLLLAGGLAVALLFAHAAKDNPISFESFLFGSILTISQQETYFFIGVCVAIIALMLVLWRRFVMLVFDAEFARVQSRYAGFFEVLLMMITGLLVALALKVIGGLLVGALLVIPVLAAQNIARSFRSNVLWSVLIGVIGVVVGIVSSFYADIPASSGIVLSLIGLFCVTYAVQRLMRNVL